MCRYCRVLNLGKDLPKNKTLNKDFGVDNI